MGPQIAICDRILINPEMPIPDAARPVHGITDITGAGQPIIAPALPPATAHARGRPPLAAPTFHLTARPRLCSAATWPCCLAVPGLRPEGLVIREGTLPVSTFMNDPASLGDADVTLSLIYSKMKGIDSRWSKQPRRTATLTPLRPRNRPSTPAKHPFALPDGLQRQLARAQANMAAPFTGITTDGHVVPQH